MTANVDGKERAKRLWGACPTGSIAGGSSEPGTREFFERALKFRSEHEQPWLRELVPFGAMWGKRVLEIGCGPGYDALTFMQNGANYVGIDIAPENIERAKKHLRFYGFDLDVRVGDAEHLHFESGIFDVVYSNGVLHHVPDIGLALAEAARVLRPGGDLFLIVYNKNSIVFRVTTMIDALKSRRPIASRVDHMEYNANEITPIVNVYTKREVIQLLEKAGLMPIATSVRKLVLEDLPAHRRFESIYRHIPQAILDAIAKLAGWYIVARARKT